MNKEEFMKKHDIPNNIAEKLIEMNNYKAVCDVTPEQSLAIDKAERYGLGAEVEYLIFEEGMSPEEALREWDIE